MGQSTAPDSDSGLVERLRAIGPLVSEHARRGEQERRVTKDVVEALASTGIYRMNVPRRYGGYQTELHTQIDAIAEIAAKDGSAAFVVLLQTGCSFIAALFPDKVQDEIFADPDVRVSGTLIPDATALRVDGGYLVNGTSAFATGCQDADWHLLTTRVVSNDPPAGPPELLWMAIPMAELSVVDDWHVSGLCGSGSNSVTAHDVHVPGHRALPVGPMLGGVFPSQANAADPFYWMPVLALFCAWAAPAAIGLARSALAEFTERARHRGITYTFYRHQNEAAVTHLQTAEAAMKISCAELLTSQLVSVIEAKAATGDPYTQEERARIRGQGGYLTRLCTEAADLLGSASGANSLRLDVPIQRTIRDLHALSLHSFINPATSMEIYGRVLSGLDPGTPFL